MQESIAVRFFSCQLNTGCWVWVRLSKTRRQKIGKNVNWSDESGFLLQHADGRVRTGCKQHNPCCLVPKIQAGGGELLWGIIVQHTLYQLRWFKLCSLLHAYNTVYHTVCLQESHKRFHQNADCAFLRLLQVFDCLPHRELNVTVLSDSSVAEYKTADYLCCSSAPFLRSLHSGAFSGQSVCQSLEQPNIVTGLPAAGTAIAHLR